ncbi:hypothetical protein K7432_002088 [Basidiobolus ranarum]|uniref:Uncharacterized protein n=1 Tax=Basidiobolus ranarum TaxID=34480 RepID=A0ABR2X204_9FUNG
MLVLSPVPFDPPTIQCHTQLRSPTISRKRNYNDINENEALPEKQVSEDLPVMSSKSKKIRASYFATTIDKENLHPIPENVTTLTKLQISTKLEVTVNTTTKDDLLQNQSDTQDQPSHSYHDINNLLATLHRDRLQRVNTNVHNNIFVS